LRWLVSNRLATDNCRRVELARSASHVQPARRDAQVGARQRELKRAREILRWRCGRAYFANDVDHLGRALRCFDRDGFVPVGIHIDAALLDEHATVVLAGIESGTRKVSCHGWHPIVFM
jgi:hypothetical protein